MGRLATTLTVCCALVTGCRADSGPGEYTLESLPELRAVADARIGSADDPDVGFSRIAGVDVDEAGTIYVSEALDVQIRVYDESGALLRRIGRQGGGPGEFQSPPRFGVAGDTLWTYDMMSGRITLFRRDGTVLSTGTNRGLAIPLPAGRGFITPHTRRADGLFTSEFTRVASSSNDPPTGVRPEDPIPVPRVLFDAMGAVVDTIGWDPAPPPRMVPPPGASEGRFRFTEVGGARYMVPDPPSPLAHWFALDDGRIILDQPTPAAAGEAAFTVTRTALGGDTVYHRTIRYAPIRYEPAELDSIATRAARGGFMAGPSPGPAQPGVVRALRAEMRFPDVKPAIQYGWLGQDESLWLRVEGRPDESARWVVLAPDGNVRGQVTLPPGSRVVWSGGDRIWVAELDAMDVPWLVRYRLSEGVR